MLRTQAQRLLLGPNNVLVHRPAATALAFRALSTVGSNQHQHSQGAAFQAKSSSCIAAAATALASGALLGAIIQSTNTLDDQGGSLLCQCEGASANSNEKDSSNIATPTNDKQNTKAGAPPTAPMATSAGYLGGGSLFDFGTTEVKTLDDEEEEEALPTYTMAQVSQNNGKNPQNDRVWMTYGGSVYDVTDFISNHPGGVEKILQAAGGPIEPHWHLYRQHFNSDLPMKLMEQFLIGHLHEKDQEKVDAYMEHLDESEEGDPYRHEPIRSPLLKVHGETPMNAEVPREILGQSYITPSEMFYIRHHHPVPLLSEQEVQDFRLQIDLSLLTGTKNDKEEGQETAAKLSLEQIKSLPKADVTTTLQCSGNRRSGFNTFKQTSGTPWDQGAISTAKWSGARLVDVLLLASQQLASSEKNGPAKSNDSNDLLSTLHSLQTLLSKDSRLQHLRFESLDGMQASIDIVKALNPFGDVILAYEMNDEPLSRDHGYPLRVIVPGYAAVRNVKWLSKLELAEEEATGMWQRGLNYKVLPPSVLDANQVDLNKMPGLSEVSVFSGITTVAVAKEKKKMVPGETVMVKASGWAWAGGGRNIVRVDVTGDSGKSWADATITQGSNQQHGRAWAYSQCTSDRVRGRSVCRVELQGRRSGIQYSTRVK